ncbi:N-alpha-acetyltransferase 25, NatB auxiliary subunit-like [Amphiura filiformis]|uniref:N-alpha-acetyltransferase 25, NatB auxiliary subunit-like n=1 Tax=Amphiura filiformis TaxID=82378 RepID=UPI003B2117C9
MASRGGTHVDDAVNERRLKPIYDNLDNGNYKTAIQLADKVLKKHRDLHCAKVLKSLALLRMGKSAESFTLTQDVVAMKPSDEPTLQALSICFREMQKPEQIVDIYTEAVKVCPTHEDYHTHLFMALVRVGDYKRQQQVAMALYKVYPKNPYYFWGVMSILMQGLTATDPKLANIMYLPLAEKMIEKMVKEERIEAEAEVNIYLMVLDCLGKHEKALEVVEGKLGNFLQADLNSRATKRAALLGKLERWPEMNCAYKDLIALLPDNWFFFQQYFESAFALIDKEWSLPEDESEREKVSSTDHTVQKVLDFVTSKVERENQKVSEQNNAKKSHQLRAPYLAQLELLLLMTGRSSPEAQRIGNPADLLSNYFAMYGHKPVCFKDLRPYLNLVPSEERSSFIQSLLDTVKLEKAEGAEIAFATEAKQMQRHICVVQMTRHLGLHSNLSAEETLALIKELVQRHQRGLSFGKELLKTDLQYSDDYLLIAVHLLLDAWQKSGDDSQLFMCIVILEQGLKFSQSSHHMKLLLIRLYCLVGAFGPVPVLYDGADIKHIQQDTIGYNAARYVIAVGHLSKANALYHTFLKFYTVNHKDTTEYIITSYKFGTFHKIPEFMKFRNRINHSLHFAQTTVEKMLLELYQEADNGNHTLQDMVRDMEIVPEKDEIEWDNLHDNRDLGVLATWVPPERHLSTSQKEDSKAQEATWLRLRTLFLRALAAAAHLVPKSQQSSASSPATTNDAASKNGEAPDRGVTLQRLTEEWQELLTKAQEDPVTHKKFPIQGPPESRTAEYIRNQHPAVLVQLFRLVSAVQQLQVGMEDATKTKDLQDSIDKDLSSITDLLTEILKKSRRSVIFEEGESKKFDIHVLSELVVLTETMTFAILLTSVMCKLLKPIKNAINKRNKKKKGATAPPKPMPPVFERFRNYMESMCQIGEALLTALEDVNTTFVTDQFSQFNLLGVQDSQGNVFDDQDAVEKEMWKKIQESYEESTKEVGDVFKKRMAFLKTLKL